MMKRQKQAPERTLVGEAHQAIESCAGLNARFAARQLTGFIEERMRDTELSLAQFGLLAHIAAARDDTIGALAERSGLDQSTLSRNLRGLQKEGLVEIVTAERDLRRRAVWLTEKGARRLAGAMPSWRRAQAALGERLDAQALLALQALAATLAGLKAKRRVASEE